MRPLRYPVQFGKIAQKILRGAAWDQDVETHQEQNVERLPIELKPLRPASPTVRRILVAKATEDRVWLNVLPDKLEVFVRPKLRWKSVAVSQLANPLVDVEPENGIRVIEVIEEFIRAAFDQLPVRFRLPRAAHILEDEPELRLDPSGVCRIDRAVTNPHAPMRRVVFFASTAAVLVIQLEAMMPRVRSSVRHCPEWRFCCAPVDLETCLASCPVVNRVAKLHPIANVLHLGGQLRERNFVSILVAGKPPHLLFSAKVLKTIRASNTHDCLVGCDCVCSISEIFLLQAPKWPMHGTCNRNPHEPQQVNKTASSKNVISKMKFDIVFDA